MVFELVKKPIQYSFPSTKKLKRKSEKTKNEMMREMIQACTDNALKFRFVLMESWFSSEENFEFIACKGHYFIAALKDNRLIALSEEDKHNECFVCVDDLDLPEQTAVRGWLKGYPKEVFVVRQVFKNKDDSTGILHLVCSDLTGDYDVITTTYKKTVASGGISQILEVQCQSGQVSYQDAANPRQPRLHCHLCNL